MVSWLLRFLGIILMRYMSSDFLRAKWMFRYVALVIRWSILVCRVLLPPFSVAATQSMSSSSMYDVSRQLRGCWPMLFSVAP